MTFVPHDPRAFTQGLVFHGDSLYESTGLFGKSSLRRLEVATGSVVEEVRLDATLFGEGIASVGDYLVQVTWKNRIGFVWRTDPLEIVHEFTYEGEAWGLASDANALFVSDGSSTLRIWDISVVRGSPSVTELGRLSICDGSTPVELLNDLQYVSGRLLANIWGSPRVACIGARGRLAGWLDFSGLDAPNERHTGRVLNGIAFNERSRRLFLTAKKWHKLAVVSLNAAEQAGEPLSYTTLSQRPF